MYTWLCLLPSLHRFTLFLCLPSPLSLTFMTLRSQASDKASACFKTKKQGTFWHYAAIAQRNGNYLSKGKGRWEMPALALFSPSPGRRLAGNAPYLGRISWLAGQRGVGVGILYLGCSDACSPYLQVSGKQIHRGKLAELGVFHPRLLDPSLPISTASEFHSRKRSISKPLVHVCSAWGEARHSSALEDAGLCPIIIMARNHQRKT